MKRSLALLAALPLLLCTACGGGKTPTGPDIPSPGETVNISLWTFPIGGWGDEVRASAQINAFNRTHSDINVSLHIVDYVTGDKEVEEAIEAGDPPDLILEGPERLVANWGARGLMVDLKDLWEDETAKKINENIAVACHDTAGAYYIYPMCTTTHCMAINRDLFEAADAWQYIDETNRTWKTADFFSAVEKLKAHGMETVAAVYCKGQGGDQGTRALVNNLYGGTFTDKMHTRYTVESPQNIRALEELKAADGIVFADDMLGSDEVEKFSRGELAMAFCWNVSSEIGQIRKYPNLDFDIFPIAFPTETGEAPSLQGGIWGFGVFDKKDAKRRAAAETFIRYMLQDDEHYSAAVNLSTYRPVREMKNLYVNDKLMEEYGLFDRYFGDYYQVTSGWADARTAWWNMLQEVGRGEDVAKAVAAFSAKVNKQ